jgi:ribosomal protein S18 acetylase RimI-like enzyme
LTRDLAASFAARAEVDAWVAGSAVPLEAPLRGTLLRSPRFPSAWDLNQVVLAPGADADAVRAAVAVAERELEGAAHRRVTISAPAAVVAARDGWEREELLVMLAPDVAAGGPWPAGVEEVGASELDRDRLEMWRLEGVGDAAAELAAMQLAFASYPGARCVGVRRDGRFVAWAQVVNGAIDDVWVSEPFRGQGLGRAVTRATLACGGWYLWTDVADPRPQGLYRSLGFVDAGRLVQLTRHAT